MEQKVNSNTGNALYPPLTLCDQADQVMNLTDVLEVRDKPYMVPVANAIKASKARLNFPDSIHAMRRDVNKACVE